MAGGSHAHLRFHQALPPVPHGPFFFWSYCAYTPQAASCSLLTPAGVLQVKTDKQREVDNGHDGTWVAHPALVTLALEIFNASMPSANQIPKSRSDVQVGLPLVATFP